MISTNAAPTIWNAMLTNVIAIGIINMLPVAHDALPYREAPYQVC
jgi:hypothetical protein